MLDLSYKSFNNEYHLNNLIQIVQMKYFILAKLITNNNSNKKLYNKNVVQIVKDHGMDCNENRKI